MTTSPTWVVTTEHKPWFTPDSPVRITPMDAFPDALLQIDQPGQRIDGFGVSFSEMGWAALSYLSEEDRQAVLAQVFSPEEGNASLGRLPIGGNDLSLEWYSYDETPGDFELADFSVAHDEHTLIPFVQAAKRQRPELSLWASPWCPPTWMKTNGHYACAAPNPLAVQTRFDNGLSPHRAIPEGTDAFILEPEHLAAYARYFGAYIDAYAERGIRVSMVMPQNEFNSDQIFPSCTWTPQGLIAFLRHLIPEMTRRDVAVFLGTVERADDSLVETILADPEVAPHIDGVGFQWAGKRALPHVHHAHPELTIYQSEQECGDGRNDWRYARYAWTMMRHYLSHGANAYMYWNVALEDGGVSRWGWSQNSLVTVHPESATYSLNHEYYVWKHLSHFVAPGARFLPSLSYTGYENVLGFCNPDGSVVIAAQNDMSAPLPMRFGVGNRLISVTMPEDCLSTIHIPAEALA